MKNKRKQILLTWDAFNNGFVVTAQTVKLLWEKYNIQINEIFYLQSQSLQKSNLAEIDVFWGNTTRSEALKSISENERNKIGEEKLRSRLRDCYEISENFKRETKNLPKFKNKNVNINNVTDYQSIYDNLAELIKKEFHGKDNLDLHINVSPGTPHMHVVWLMLNSAGYLPVNTTLWSSQWIRETKKTVINKIKFKPKTFLSEILKSKYLKTHLPEINPNETKSQKRQEAEKRLELFSHIPNVPMLLLGERGTGKSTYARTLVKRYQEGGLPFVELACGTFSEELMRDELFGHEKGAFTGADKEKKGFLAKFNKGGILFLDEIHDLTKPLQRQLMQVLQTGVYYPIGSIKPVKAIFRLITASNLAFEELANKRLDADFLDRIARFIIEIPPLRHCKEDLESYWSKVWKEVADFDSAPKIVWNKELYDFIQKHYLPGNFRDLQKIASYIIAYFLDTKNKTESVSLAIQEYKKWRQKTDTDSERSYFKRFKTYNEIIAEFNKDLVNWAINEYGNKKKTSEILNRSESMLTKDLNQDRLK
ncbi:MAG: sigma-54-dependent Fis family transcriptional regulator [Chlorobi bacterium]|nr:sigma-54-dependent Fis family transcriptional regulator [Chlorobiota bacterium]